jgi:hypothetical protein
MKAILVCYRRFPILNVASCPQEFTSCWQRNFFKSNRLESTDWPGATGMLKLMSSKYDYIRFRI